MNVPAPTPAPIRRARATWILFSTCTAAALAADPAPTPAAPAAPAAPPASTGTVAAKDDAKPAPPASGETRPPRAIHTVSPKHPEALRQKLIAGECEIECVVGTDGRVVYTKVVSATQPEFGEAAMAALRQWEFQPGMRNGQPVPMNVRIPFAFTFTTEQVLEIIAKRPVFREVTDTIIPAEQLPVWPQPTQIYLPPYPSELKGSGKHGKVVLSIIVDKDGHVINPKIVKSTYPEFVMPALATAVRLVYIPQKIGGQNAGTVCVSMNIQYDFNDPSGRTAPGTAEGKHPKDPKKTKPD